MPARLTRVSPDGDTQEFDEEPWKKMEKVVWGYLKITVDKNHGSMTDVYIFVP